MTHRFERPRSKNDRRRVVAPSNAITPQRLHELATNLLTCPPESFEANARGFHNVVDAYVEAEQSARAWAAMEVGS